MMTPLPGNIFSPTFKKQRLGWLFTAIMTIMVYLATLAMALQATISSTSMGWDQKQQGRFTIEFPQQGEENITLLEGQIKLTLTALASMEEIQEAARLPDSEIAHLLQRWIADPEMVKALPLPTLIDVQVKPDKNISADLIRQRLSSITPNVRVNDHADWLMQMHNIMLALALLGWILLTLTAVALIIAINLICRAVMAVEQKTIELMHVMGATDKTIADTFAQHTYNLSWPAAVLGFALAVFTAGSLSLMMHYFTATGSASLTTWIVPGLMLIAVPCLAVIGSVITARLAALSLLRQQI